MRLCVKGSEVSERMANTLAMEPGRRYVVTAVEVPRGFRLAEGEDLKKILPAGSLEFWNGCFVRVNGGRQSWPLDEGLYLVPDDNEAAAARRLLAQLERRAS